MPDEIQVEHWGDDGEFSARDPYVERYWLRFLGPSALVVVRRCALDAQEAPFHRYDTEAFASECGLGVFALSRTLDRLREFRLATVLEPAEGRLEREWWEVRATVPALEVKQAHRLPERLRRELAAL